MKKWKDQWKELLPYEKCASVALQIIMAIVLPVLVMRILRLMDILQSPIDFAIASHVGMSLYSGCYAVRCWRKQRGTAILYIVSAVLFAISAIWYCL